MLRKYTSIAAIAGSIVIISLAVPAIALKADQYQGLAEGVQAGGVVVALIFGAATLYSDRHDRRVDRVLDLHASMTTGNLLAARLRLIDHIRPVGGRVKVVSLNELRQDPQFSSYHSHSETTPSKDAALILRYMERANAARRARIIETSLFHELIGIHVLWWDRAISNDDSEPLRETMRDLAQWVLDHRKQTEEMSYVEGWEKNLLRDFGYSLP